MQTKSKGKIQNNIKAPVMEKVTKGDYANTRDLNLVRMILSLESNNSNDFDKVFDVYDTYRDMKEMKVSNEFRQSLENSKGCLLDTRTIQTRLNDLKQDDPNSFLVLPVMGKGHLWSSVVKKTDEGFNAIVLNKGMRYWHDPAEEFVFKKENISKLDQAVRFGFGINNIEDVYRGFKNGSDAAYNLKIATGAQKVGNCFTKNIQGAIKHAFATSNISYSRIKQLRAPSKYTAFGTPSPNKKTFKWNIMSTEEMQKLFARSISKNNPAIQKGTERSIDIYSKNKHFRDELKHGKEATTSLISTFDPRGTTANLGKEDRLKKLVGDMSMFNYQALHPAVEKIVKQTNDEGFKKIFNVMDTIGKLTNNSSRNGYFGYFMEAKHDVRKSMELIFDGAGEHAKLPPNEKAKVLVNELNVVSLKEHKAPIQKFLGELYGAEKISREYSRLLDNAITKDRNTEMNLKPIKKHLVNLKKYFPVIAESMNENFSIHYNKVAKSCLYDKKDPDKALSAIEKALIFSKNDDNLLTRGVALQSVSRSKEAMKNLTQAIKVNPKNYLAYLARGDINYKTNNKLAAKEDLKKAYKLNPSTELKKRLENYKSLNLKEISKQHKEIFR